MMQSCGIVLNFNPEQVTNDCVYCNGDHELKVLAESGYAIIRCEQVDIIYKIVDTYVYKVQIKMKDEAYIRIYAL